LGAEKAFAVVDAGGVLLAARLTQSRGGRRAKRSEGSGLLKAAKITLLLAFGTAFEAVGKDIPCSSRWGEQSGYREQNGYRE
jgi:hypothetical protein